MSLYAIGDFHLSFTVNKPMDVFDKRWKNHVVKIEKYLKKKVTERAAVVITRDHSWGVEFGGVSGGSGFHYDVCRAGRFCFVEIMICSGMRRRRRN